MFSNPIGLPGLCGAFRPLWFRGSRMKFVTIPVIAVVLGMSLGPAQAFQETQLGTPAAPSTPAKANEAGSSLGVTPGLSMMTPSQKKAAESKENSGVTIPGFGHIGLPKMNFGLELLYGEGEVREPATKPQDAPIDELMIRGSVKHNF